MTATEPAVDREAAVDGARSDDFAGRLMSIYSGAVLSYMIDLGHRTGLLRALAREPVTCDRLARGAGLQERYVREWLGAMVTGGLVDYDPRQASYWLRPERAECLTDGPFNLAPLAQFNTLLGKHLHKVARAFREGGGVPYAEFRPELTDVMDAVGRGGYDAMLLDAYVPLVPGLVGALASGIRVADVGCGTGHALVVLARAFRASSFVGFDLDDGAIARARAEARGADLANVRFEVQDVARLAVEEPFDAVLVFDAVHEQVDPVGVLARIHGALRPGGRLVMKEPRTADRLEDGIGHAMAPWLFGVSTLHCLPVSLAHGGAGIGSAFTEGLARRLLVDAGFSDIEAHPAPGDPGSAVYVAVRD